MCEHGQVFLMQYVHHCQNVLDYLSENISNQWICMYNLLSIFMYIIQY